MPHFLVKCRFASFWRISRGFKYVLLFSINKCRDIRLIALLKKLSCFLEAGASAEPRQALNMHCCSRQTNTVTSACLPACFAQAFWKPVPHFLVKCRFASFWRISRGLKYVLLFSINKYRDIRLIALLRKLSCFLEASRTSWSTAGLNVSVFLINKYIGTSG